VVVSLETIRYLGPELFLALVASFIYVAGAFHRSRGLWTAVALGGYVLAALLIHGYEAPGWSSWHVEVSVSTTSGPIVVDFLGYWLRCLALVVGVLFTLIAARDANYRLASEFAATLMLLIVGMMLVARANNLVLMFVSLELISIPTYVLLFLGPRGQPTSEATVKYFFLSVLASAFFLYGMSMLYGITGTTTMTASDGYASIQSADPQSAAGIEGLGASLAPVALLLLVAGLGFKIAAFPFHFYAPDVYQGSTNANAGLLAVAPKIAGIAAIIRILVVGMPWLDASAWQLAVVLAVLTMTIGNVCALWQNNIRRLMAYSSIAHAGYMLIGLAAALAWGQGSSAAGGISAAMFYLCVYAFASLGTFAALTYLGSDTHEVSHIDELAGVSRTHPAIAAMLAIFMFSLAGIPPLAGFWGKFTLFTGAISTAANSTDGQLPIWFVTLAVFGAVNAAIAGAYYLRIVATMYFRSEEPRTTGSGWGPLVATAVCAATIVFIGVFPGHLATATRAAETAVGKVRREMSVVVAQPAVGPVAAAGVATVATSGSSGRER